MTLATWILAAMSAWIPPADADAYRYYQIAHDIAHVAEEHPIYSGRDAVAKTALLMASIASFESQFRADVDDGRVRGDQGLAYGLMQVHLRRGEVLKTRVDGLRIALARMEESFEFCRHVPRLDRLSGYTRGVCVSDMGSRLRIVRAERYWKAHPYADVEDAPDRGLQAKEGAPSREERP